MIEKDRAPNTLPAIQWFELPQKILRAAERLQGIQIESQPALQLLKRYNRPDVLVYADPPYPLSTRHGRMYRHEMTDGDHLELLYALANHLGPVLISGYAHPIYDEYLKHWRRETKVVQSGSGQPRTEVLWINSVAVGAVEQMAMF